MNNLQRFRSQLKNGTLCLGTAITLNDSAVSELMAEAGYDFTWIDMEHAPLDLQAVLQHVMALRGTPAVPFVRVRCNDANVIKPVLDLAPAGIIVPNVNSAQEAEAAVRACKYPPRGVRGYGPRRGQRYGVLTQAEYLANADDEIFVILQIEHRRAVENIDSLLKVPGIDSICLGPNDLSGSYGKLGELNDPEVAKAMDTVIRKAREAGIYVGVSTGYHPDTLPKWLAKGVHWLNLNVDWANLFVRSQQVVESVRDQLAKESEAA